MFKEKVNAQMNKGRTIDHDISSLAYGQWSKEKFWEEEKMLVTSGVVKNWDCVDKV